MNARQRRLVRRAFAREDDYLMALAYGVEPEPRPPRPARHVADLMGLAPIVRPRNRRRCHVCGRTARYGTRARPECSRHTEDVPF